MALNSFIDWTDHTWNPWVGCTKISDGCANCYMFRDQHRFGKDPTAIRRTSPSTWKQVNKYNAGDRVFVCSWSDFFHPDVPDEWRLECYRIFESRQDVTWMLLTKRPDEAVRFTQWMAGADHISTAEWPRQCWLGVTAENQEQADNRIPILLRIPAAVRFVSVEPMLDAVDLRNVFFPHGGFENVLECRVSHIAKRAGVDKLNGIDWVMCGGESGPGARPMHPEWARSLRDQCVADSIPFFFKQWGKWEPVCQLYAGDQDEKTDGRGELFALEPNGSFEEQYQPSPDAWLMEPVGKKKAGRLLDGVEWNQYPEVSNGTWSEEGAV